LHRRLVFALSINIFPLYLYFFLQGGIMQSPTLQSPAGAAKLARDLKRDLGHLRRHGIDPDTFLAGALANIARRVEQHAIA
jgi:hypothetical protein